MYSFHTKCFKHSNFFTVCENLQQSRFRMARDNTQQTITNVKGQVTPTRNSTTNFLTATTLVYAIEAGITAAAGTRLALQLILVEYFKLHSFHSKTKNGSAIIFVVTASACCYWAICAPAAFLGCISRLSGLFSGIEP